MFIFYKGKTMETVDIYFSWLLGEDTDVFYTNSPVVETVFNLPGNYVVFVNLTNPGNIFRKFKKMLLLVVLPEKATYRDYFRRRWRRHLNFLVRSITLSL